jgi:hypothetical protein
MTDGEMKRALLSIMGVCASFEAIPVAGGQPQKYNEITPQRLLASLQEVSIQSDTTFHFFNSIMLTLIDITLWSQIQV